MECLNIEYDALKCNHHALLGGIIALRDGFNKYGDANKDILSPWKPGNTSPLMAKRLRGWNMGKGSCAPHRMNRVGQGQGIRTLSSVGTARRAMWNPT